MERRLPPGRPGRCHRRDVRTATHVRPNSPTVSQGFWASLGKFVAVGMSRMSVDAVVMTLSVAVFLWARFGDRAQAAVGFGPKVRGLVTSNEREAPTLARHAPAIMTTASEHDAVHRKLDHLESRVGLLSEQLNCLAVINQRQSLKEAQSYLASIPGMLQTRDNAEPEYKPQHLSNTQRKIQRVANILNFAYRSGAVSQKMDDIRRNLDFDISKGRVKVGNEAWALLERQHEFLVKMAEGLERELDGVPPDPRDRSEFGAAT